MRHNLNRAGSHFCLLTTLCHSGCAVELSNRLIEGVENQLQLHVIVLFRILGCVFRFTFTAQRYDWHYLGVIQFYKR